MVDPVETNEELLERYKNGDFAGFEAFFRRNQSFILNLLRYRLGNKGDAEDAFQETFLRLHRNITSYDSRQKALAWVFTITKNVAIDHLRSRRRRASELDEEEPATLPTSELIAIAREELEQLAAAMSAEERELVKGRFLNDESFESLAERFGTSSSNIRQRLSRLMKRLRV